MANWKKVIVSGSQANLAGVSGSLLTHGRLLFGSGSGVGAITSAANVVLNDDGHIEATFSGSASGSFEGDGSGLTGVVATIENALVDGAGIVGFNYDGGTADISIAVEPLASRNGQIQPISVEDAGVGFDVSLIDGTGLTAADGVLNVGGLTVTEFNAANVVTSGEVIQNSTTGSDDTFATTKAIKDYVDSQSHDDVNLGYTSAASQGTITNDQGTDAVIPGATATVAGLLTTALSGSIAANSLKVSNVSTDLSEGTSTETTVDVNSSDGTNATLLAASTTRAGLMTKAKFDEVEANNAKVSNVAGNLGYTAAVSSGTITTSNGTSATVPLANATNAGLMTAAEKSAIAANSLKTVQGTALEIEVSEASGVFTVGLPDDVTITGNLTVNGDTTTLNTTNLLVEDKFILLSSGSASDSDGGIVIDGGDDNGEGFVYDATAGNATDAGRWGFQSSMADLSLSTTNSAPDAFVSAVVVGTDNTVPAAGNRYTAKGNIFVAANEDIFIYS